MSACLATGSQVGRRKWSIAAVGVTCRSLAATSCFTTRRIEVPKSLMRLPSGAFTDSFATVAETLAGREPIPGMSRGLTRVAPDGSNRKRPLVNAIR